MSKLNVHSGSHIHLLVFLFHMVSPHPSSEVLRLNFHNKEGILGNKSLLLVIRSPIGTKINGRFLIGAEVSSRLSKWFPYPVRTTDDKVVNVEYDLSK